MVLIHLEVFFSLGVSVHPLGSSTAVSSSHCDRSPRKKEAARRVGWLARATRYFSTANAEYVQGSATEEAPLEGGALPAEAARRAVGRHAATVEGGAAEAAAE